MALKDKLVNLEDLGVVNDRVSDLKSAFNNANERLSSLDGVQNLSFEIGQRYVNNGAEAWYNNVKRMSLKRGTYLHLKAGEKIYLKNTMDYAYYGGYSTDNGTTWTSIGTSNEPFTASADLLMFVGLRKLPNEDAFTNDEIGDMESIFIVVTDDYNITGRNAINADIIKSAASVFDLFSVPHASTGVTHQWLTANATVTVSADTIIPYCPANKGDVFLIKADASATFPTNFTVIGIRIYEKNNSDVTLASYDVSDISVPTLYTVQNNNTTKLGAYILVMANEGTIATGYREVFVYDAAIAKKIASDVEETLTESGESWEV